MGFIRRGLGSLLAMFALAGATQSAVAAVSVEFTGGTTVDIVDGQFLKYQTTFSDVDGKLESAFLAQRPFDEGEFKVGLIRVDETLFGLTAYWGLAALTDPDTGDTFSGNVLAVELADPTRTKLLAVVFRGQDKLGSVMMYLDPAPDYPVAPPVNNFLADSIAPIGHVNSAQSDSLEMPGPLGPSDTLQSSDISYEFIGPAHFGLAISPTYGNGSRRVYWSNGGDRISKLDYETMETIAELEIKSPLMTEAESESRVTEMDGLSGEALPLGALPYAIDELFGLAGVYYLLDSDNTLFVGGSESILAYGDVVEGWWQSPIELKAEWVKPAEVGGNFVGANITFDGKICMVTDEGWIVIVDRDFTNWSAIELDGNEIAPQHNADMIAAGFRPGSASWVRNSVAIDENGGIYVPSLEHMHKVIWDGTTLSKDPLDGAWTEPFLNGRGIGSGATPSLMGFGDEDKFVVITDGEDLMNVVLYWRDDIPAGWTAPAGAPSNRIAGQLPADFDDPTLTAVQSEQSVIVGGYGAAVVNNEPPTAPPVGFPALATAMLAGYAGNDLLYAPTGIQKMQWNPVTQTFEDAWVQPSVSSANSVPIVSTRSNIMYTVGGRGGEWSLEAVDWNDGSSAFHWITGSQRYNTRFSGLFLDEEGRVVHTTTYGIMRYER